MKKKKKIINPRTRAIFPSCSTSISIIPKEPKLVLTVKYYSLGATNLVLTGRNKRIEVIIN
jgi:hypothetical protein